MAALIIVLFVTAGLAQMQPQAPNVKLNSTAPKGMGNQESITFYRSNGSSINLNAIPRPLLTNVTAENVVGVAPITSKHQMLPWSALKDFSSYPQEAARHSKVKRDLVKTEKGAALIPKDAGLQSIALPPLIALNNNLSKIPVPLPNVSVVSYAKVNTLIHGAKE